MRHVKPNPRYETNNPIGFDLISRESLEHSESSSYEEVMNSSKFQNWRGAMKEEMKFLLENKT